MLGTDFLRTGYKARDTVFEAFREYFQRIPDDASFLVQQRQKVMREGGIAEEDTYKIQATLSNAAYPNTVPTLFWTIFEIYSRPQLLDDIRQELHDNAVSRASEKGTNEFVLDVAALQTTCPVLLSTYQETQRTRHAQVAWRMVTKDTLLDGHVLKKGNYLQIPVRPTHESREVWGPRAAAFDPYRFVPGKNKPKIAPSSFMPWGSPPHLCPARQFASAEILIAAALLVLRVQLTPVGGRRGGGGWEQPALRSGTPALPRPRRDIRAKVTPREGARGNWSVVIGRAKARISLASG